MINRAFDSIRKVQTKHLVWEFIIGVSVLLFDMFILKKEGVNIPEWTKVWVDRLISLSNAVLVTFLIHRVHLYEVEAERLAKVQMEYVRERDTCLVELTQRDSRLAFWESIVESLQLWFDLGELKSLRALSSRLTTAAYISVVQQGQLELATKFQELVEKGSADATYHQQIQIADALSTASKCRFWATSTDAPADFQRQNYFYLQTLMDVGKRCDEKESDVPPVARIFIGRSDEFRNELTTDSSIGSVLDLYEWHLRWGVDAGAPSRPADKVPLRFLSDDHEAATAIFSESQIKQSPIRDFLLVDQQLVYGRTTEARRPVELRLAATAESVAKYHSVFVSLWKNSYTIERLVEKLQDAGKSVDELDTFAEQCKKRESKLHIEHDYKAMFSLQERAGDLFFGCVCSTIESATGICFAIDRADHKTQDIIASWKQDDAYKEMMRVCKFAAPRCKSFRRLYLLDEKLRNDPKELAAFIQESTDAKIEVGFLLKRALTNEDKVTSAKLRYDTDFIVTDYKGVNAFGFELQESEFDTEKLTWDKNLIAHKWIDHHYEFFVKLWDNKKIVTFVQSDSPSLRLEKVNKIVTGGRA